MGIILGYVISAASVMLQIVSTLDVTAASPWSVYQPKTPKSLLR